MTVTSFLHVTAYLCQLFFRYDVQQVLRNVLWYHFLNKIVIIRAFS